MRIAVVGAGGTGGYFGGKLAQAGEDVAFLARGATLEAIRLNGLRVDSTQGGFLVQPAHATDDPREIGPVDVVLMTVKTYQLPEALQASRPLLGPSTAVVPLQNGVEAPAQIAAALGAEHAAGGLCAIVAYQVAPGHVRHAGSEPLVRFGELDNRPSPRLERLRQAFLRAGVQAEIPPDIEVALWMKLLVIAPWSGIGAMTRTAAGVWRNLPETRRMAEQSLDEAIAVARARGVRLPADAREQTVKFMERFPQDATASMQRDIAEGRRSELEAQIGVLCRMGREAGVPTPLNDMIYAGLLPADLKARGMLA